MKDKLHEGAVRRLRETELGLRIAAEAKKEKDRSVELAPRYKYRANVKERRQSVIQDQVNKSHVTSIIHSMPKDLEYISDERIAQEHKVLIGDLLAAKENQQAPNLPAEYKSDSAWEGVLDTTNDSILPLDWVRSEAMATTSRAAESDQYPRSVGKRLSGELTAGALESVRGSRSARRRAGLNNSIKNKGRGLGLLAQFIPPSDDQEAVNTSLAECLMLVGPSPADVYAVVEQAASPLNQASDAHVGMVSLEPAKLYMTDMAHGGDGMEMDALPSFCFPVGIHTHATPPQSRRSSSRVIEPRHSHRTSGAMSTVISPQMDARFFTFVLSGHTTSQYGVCMRIGRTLNLEPRPGVLVSVDTQYCICLVTKYPFFSYIFHVMKAFDDMGGFHLDDELIERQELGFPIQRCLRFLNDFALKLRHYVVPKPSNYLNLSFSVHHKRYEAKFYRNLHRSRDVEISRQILFWGLPVLLKHMSVRDVVSAIGYTLTEMRLVVVSADPTVLSACTLALVHLLRPVRWVGPMIITLPQHLLAYLESPVPVVVGLAELPDGFEVTTDMTLVDPMLSQLELHPDDVIRSHELSMPASRDLVKQLKPLAKDIVDQWETSGATSLREPSEMVSSFEEGANLGDQPADWAPSLALDLGWDTTAGQKYCKTVTHFVDIVYKHIESILNLAIEFNSTESSSRRVRRQRAKQAERDSNAMNDGSQDDMSKNLSPDLDHSNVMSRESLTDSNVSFIHHLRDTQMFSQFDHFSSQGMTMSGHFSRKKSHSELDGDLNKPFSNSSEGGDDDYRNSVSVASIASVENIDVADGSERVSTPTDSFASLSRAERESRAGRDYDDSDDGRQAALKAERLHGLRDNEDDPMIQLFAILLTGTVQLRRDPLSDLMRGVADTADKDKDGNRRETASRRTRSGRTVIYRKSDAGGGGGGEKAGNNVVQDVVEDITWCNGRCYGRADTPTCTNICVAVWQGRVKWMKHQQFVKDMAEKRVEPPGVARPETLYKPDYSKTLKKHLNETETQFNLRVQIRDSADGRSKRPPQPQRTKHKKVLRTMRRYYAKKFARRREDAVLNALRVLKRFVLFIENGGYGDTSDGGDVQGQLSPALLSDDENGVGGGMSNTSNTSASTERDCDARPAARERGGSDMSVLEAHRAFMKIGSSASKDSLDLNMNGAFRGQHLTPSSHGPFIEGLTAMHSFNWLAHGAWPCSMGPRERAQLDQLDPVCQDKARAFVDAFVGRCVRPLTDMNSLEAEGRESPLGRLRTLSEGPHTALDQAATGDEDEETWQGQGRPPQGKIERSWSLSNAVAIVALGDGAAEHLTPQQQQAVMKLHDRLCKGVQVRKHGLTGKPRVRYLYCSDDMTRLFWRSEKVQSNDAVSRVNMGFAGKQDAARELFMSDMKEVCDDLSTDAMQRSLSKGYVTKKPNVRGVFAPGCISIILANRTMDFEAEMSDWETLYHAFKILVNLYQNILPNLKR